MVRNKKFVVWLSNSTDHRDDSWKVVWAKNIEEAEKVEIRYDKHRFFRGPIYSAAEFRRLMGIPA